MNRRLFAPRAHAPQIRAAAEPELLLYDEIGPWGIRAKDFVAELRAQTAPRLHVRINSPGGDVMDGVAIYNALRAHPADIVVHVDALAASIASLIAMAGRQVVMAANAMLMVHKAWGITIGNADQHRATADVLDKIDDRQLIQAYTARSGAAEETVRHWLTAETWFDAEEAVAARLADAVESESEESARAFDLSLYQNTPRQLLEAGAHEPTVTDLERALRDAGLSRTAAKAVLAGGLKAQHPIDRTPPRDADAAALLAASLRCLSLFQLTGSH